MSKDRDDRSDRPQKTWRERDAMRSGSRPDSGRTGGLNPTSQAYRSYKSQLNKLFDGGALPSALQRGAPGSLQDIASGAAQSPVGAAPDSTGTPGAGGHSGTSPAQGPDMTGRLVRAQAQTTLEEAKTPKALRKALGTYTAAHGFPTDEGILHRLLDLDDETVLLGAIETLQELHAKKALKRPTAARARLQTVVLSCDAPDVQAAAKALLHTL
jgi:hypothetical protein